MYSQTVVHTRNFYPSSHMLVFKANACKVGDSKPSSFFYLSEGNSPFRRGVFCAHGLFFEGCLGWAVVNQSHNSEWWYPPFIFFAYCNNTKPSHTQVWMLLQSHWTGKEKDREDSQLCRNILWYNIYTLHPQASHPPHFHQPNPFQVWGFSIIFALKDFTTFFHVSLPSRRNPSPWGLMRQGLPSAGSGTWLGSHFSDSVLGIQMSGYTPAPVKKEDNLIRKREEHYRRSSLHLRNFQDFI